jgi:hypothetical protein
MVRTDLIGYMKFAMLEDRQGSKRTSFVPVLDMAENMGCSQELMAEV